MISSLLRGNTARCLMRNEFPNGDSKASFKDACKLLDNAIARLLSERPNKSFGQRRGIVTSRTYDRLQKVIPHRIDIGEVAPYQKHALCRVQASDIMRAQLKKVKALQPVSPSSSQAEESFSAKLWNWVKKSLQGDIKRERLPFDAEKLLATFNESGIFTLRGPGLGQTYADHDVMVFSVSKIHVPGKGPKIVVGMIDCNDLATDPQTAASWATAVKLGKSHPSELTHEEANKNGAHLRRIRFADGEALITHIKEYTRYFELLIQQEEIDPPTICFPMEKIPSLTSDETEKLSQILVEIYDTPEVEKFEERNFPSLMDYAGPGAKKGLAIAQKIQKTLKGESG